MTFFWSDCRVASRSSPSSSPRSLARSSFCSPDICWRSSSSAAPRRLFRRLRLNYLLERGGVMQAVERSGSHFNPSRVLANLVFWFVMFVVIMVAANALGMETLADVFSELVGYIPSMMAAIVLLIVGIVLGRFVGGLILASAGAIQGGPTLARVGRWGVILLAIFMALQQLGIANEIVVTAFAILFGAVALALALSFGLGNRELAGEITRAWYERYKAERDAIAAAERDAELADEREAEGNPVLGAGDGPE